MDSLARYIVSDLTNIVSEVMLSWEHCDDNTTICDSGKTAPVVLIYIYIFFSGGTIIDLLKTIEDNLSNVDVRFLGTGDIIKDLTFFQLNARIFDKESNMYANEKPLDLLVKKIGDLETQLKKPWNCNLTRPMTPTKDYEVKIISPIKIPRDPISCELCASKNQTKKLKNKKGYKVHLIQGHKNETHPDLSLIPDDIGVTCLLSKDGKKCQKKFGVDQIYRYILLICLSGTKCYQGLLIFYFFYVFLRSVRFLFHICLLGFFRLSLSLFSLFCRTDRAINTMSLLLVIIFRHFELVHQIYRPYGKYLKGFSSHDRITYHPIFLEKEEQLEERKLDDLKSPSASADNMETQAPSVNNVCDIPEESTHSEDKRSVADQCTSVSFHSSEDEEIIEGYHEEYVDAMNEDFDEKFYTSSCNPRDLLEEFNMVELEVNETDDHDSEKGLFNKIVSD